MARAVGDPDSIRQLGRRIRQAGEEMERIGQGLRQALAGADWNDDTTARFEQDLQQLLKHVQSFKAEAVDAEQHLNRKASELQTYLASGRG